MQARVAVVIAAGFLLGAANPRPSATAPAASADVLESHRGVLQACKARRADWLWPLFTDHFRRGFESMAERFRTAMDAKDLKEGFGYVGDPAGFDGKAYLAGALKAQRQAEDPCEGVEGWTGLSHGPSGQHHVFAVRRADGLLFGLKFKKVDERWYLDDITQPVKAK